MGTVIQMDAFRAKKRVTQSDASFTFWFAVGAAVFTAAYMAVPFIMYFHTFPPGK